MQKIISSILFYTSFFILLTHCSSRPVQVVNQKANQETKKVIKLENTSCVCVQLWMPVCGDNGKTYSNSCFANCAKMHFTQGACAKTQID